MAEGSGRRKSGLLAPIVGGLIVIAAIIGVIAFHNQVWDALKWLGRSVGGLVTDWIPDHPGEFAAIVVFALVCFGVNFLAHISGRLRAWVFALVVEIGLWLLFWYGFFGAVKPFYELMGISFASGALPFKAVAISTLIVVLITGTIFWVLELKEEYKRREHRLSGSDE